MSTLFALKEKLATVGAELEKVSAELMDKAANAAVPIEEVQELKDKKANLDTRFNLIKEQHDKVEAEQRAQLQKSKITTAPTDEAKLVAAKAEFIRAKILGRDMSPEAKEVLATVAEPPLRAIPTSPNTSTGQNLLPTNMDKELIHEPFVKNPLRGRIGMTAIKGLELPKIDFTLDEDDFITDEGTAREIELTGDKVTFNRNKFKVKVRIADTVLHGADVNLVSYVENALRSGLAAKEKKASFKEGDGLDINSFYEDNGSGKYLITEVPGGDLYSAITNALADLHEDFRENAAVCMRFADWVTILKELSNSAVPLYGKQPEEVIGAPVFFCDAAYVTDNDDKIGTPIIGDFRYFHINYDPDTIYDSDKNVDTGDYIWVLTAWFDAKFKLRSAFRLATVSPPEA